MIESLDKIEKSVHQMNSWLKDVMKEMDWDDKNRAYLALKSTLHLLRDRLPVEEATDLGAAFPTLVRGIYYEQYNPVGKPDKMDSHVFVSRVHSELGNDPDIDPREMVSGVLSVLARHIDEGQLRHVKINVPKDIQELLSGRTGREAKA